MGCTHNKTQNGFTLVEISIVMIIIGLLIGGTFAGKKLIESARVMKTISLLKSVETATITFQSTYGRPPGDFAFPSQRLRNCTDLPCSRAGNGNRIIGTMGAIVTPLNPTNTENYAFWHHLTAANLLDKGLANTTNYSFGAGQPSLPLASGTGLRAGDTRSPALNICTAGNKLKGSVIALAYTTGLGLSSFPPIYPFSCNHMRKIDTKLDDGMPWTGRFQTFDCTDTYTCTSEYNDLRMTYAAYYGIQR
jgi:prepilin-type N-terminal cleavage/methylation domain-containing protein